MRRLRAYAVIVLLLAAAAVAGWRSVEPRTDSADSIAAGLLCPACQGETVAQSQSPMAAAMRDTIAAQLTAGRSAGQIRRYFVDRYGSQVLAEPPTGGWAVPRRRYRGCTWPVRPRTRAVVCTAAPGETPPRRPCCAAACPAGSARPASESRYERCTPARTAAFCPRR